MRNLFCLLACLVTTGQLCLAVQVRDLPRLPLKQPPIFPTAMKVPETLRGGVNELLFHVDSVVDLDTSFDHSLFPNGNELCGEIYQMQSKDTPIPFAHRSEHGSLPMRNCSLEKISKGIYKLR